MRNQSEIEVASMCLDLAHDPNAAPDEVVARAERYFAFAVGSQERAARDLVEHINAITSGS